ncbi:MAG: hypothetical protein KDC33_00855 [Thermoleophilia bacterium]|nr:hypothetical protein [Thermoleophilia bacterium]
MASHHRATEQLGVVLTDRIRDLDPALVLVHDGFVESGFMSPTPSGRRVLPHYLTPGTVFALAYLGDRAVAACCVVPDGPYGLPSEAEMPLEVAAARALGGAPFELGSLVVAREHRGVSRHAVLMMIVAHLRRLTYEGGPDVAICTVAPEQARFYASCFGMRPLGEERALYGAPAVLMALPLHEMREYISGPGGIMRRSAGALFHDPHPTWLTSHAGAVHPPTPGVRRGTPSLELAG